MADKMAVWRERLAAWHGSGVSGAAFCRQRDLPYAQFVYWRRRLGTRGRGWVPVRVAPTQMAALPAVGAEGLCIELSLSGSVHMRALGAGVADALALAQGLSC